MGSSTPHGTPVRAARFITFEGGEGAGKSSHIARLSATLTAAGHEVLAIREPGSSVVGEAIRRVLLDPAYATMADRTEILLYEAARAQVVEEIIRPALARGVTVLADRFYDSTTAYQGYGRGIAVSEVAQLNALAVGGLTPDRTVVIDVPAVLGLERARRTNVPDRLEQESVDFHERVRQGFLAIAAAEPARVRVVDGTRDIHEVYYAAAFEVADLFPDVDLGISAQGDR